MADEESDDHVELGTPIVGDDELYAIDEVFDTGWVLNGPTTREFEDEFAAYVGADHAVSVVNCTAGMHMALDAVGLPDDAKVILPGQGFIANGIAVRQNGFDPIFIDVDPVTSNITPEAIAERADEADAVLLVHYAGYPCEMDAILDIAADHDLAVIEDAAHALGSEYRGEKIGVHGDATVFSFGPLKMITTGMGGMVTTERGDVADEIETFRSYGMDTDAWSREQDPKPWQYSIPRIGHNFRLSDVAAGMGLAQLEKVERFIEHRRARAADYGHELAADLMDCNVGISVHWDPPLHQHQLFREKYDTPSLPTSEALSDRLLTLPMHPSLTTEEIQHVANIIANGGA